MQHNNPFFIMKKILYSLTVLLALASCAKEQQEVSTPSAGNNDVSVSFIAEENSAQTRAFFDASATTEV